MTGFELHVARSQAWKERERWTLAYFVTPFAGVGALAGSIALVNAGAPGFIAVVGLVVSWALFAVAGFALAGSEHATDRYFALCRENPEIEDE